jgi:hypothetical protein
VVTCQVIRSASRQLRRWLPEWCCLQQHPRTSARGTENLRT